MTLLLHEDRAYRPACEQLVMRIEGSLLKPRVFETFLQEPRLRW